LNGHALNRHVLKTTVLKKATIKKAALKKVLLVMASAALGISGLGLVAQSISPFNYKYYPQAPAAASPGPNVAVAPASRASKANYGSQATAANFVPVSGDLSRPSQGRVGQVVTTATLPQPGPVQQVTTQVTQTVNPAVTSQSGQPGLISQTAGGARLLTGLPSPVQQRQIQAQQIQAQQAAQLQNAQFQANGFPGGQTQGSSAAGNPGYYIQGNQPCWDAAAAYHHVDPWLLYAIAYVESRFHTDAKNANRNGSIDLGLMQINSIWHDTLRKQGIPLSALHNACASTYIGAWILSKNIQTYGYTWRAIGAYNSATPAKAYAYAQKVYAAHRILVATRNPAALAMAGH
jgi:hypothetical protein